MGRTVSERIRQLPPARRRKVEARAAELLAEELSLRDLRRALDLTREKVAKRLRVGQDTVSRYEKRTDMLLSTLRDYVQAMGGDLTLVVEFPNRDPVRITNLGSLHDRKQRTLRRSEPGNHCEFLPSAERHPGHVAHLGYQKFSTCLGSAGGPRAAQAVRLSRR